MPYLGITFAMCGRKSLQTTQTFAGVVDQGTMVNVLTTIVIEPGEETEAEKVLIELTQQISIEPSQLHEFKAQSVQDKIPLFLKGMQPLFNNWANTFSQELNDDWKMVALTLFQLMIGAVLYSIILLTIILQTSSIPLWLIIWTLLYLMLFYLLLKETLTINDKYTELNSLLLDKQKDIAMLMLSNIR